MKRRMLLALAPAAGAALVGCTRRSTVATSEASDGRLGTVETFSGAQRKQGTKISGELLDGTPFDLAKWRGKVVAVNFWGSWCAPCRAEGPDLQAAYDTTRELGVEFLGVDVRDGRDAAKAFHDTFRVGYPSLFDPAGQVALDFSDVPPNVVPATLLLDRDLRVAAVFRKRVTRTELEAAIRALATEDAN